MKILAGCPVRNRAWCLAEHLLAMEDNRSKNWGGETYYLVNDSVDATAATLRVSFLRPDYDIFNTDDPGWTRTGAEGPRRNEANMALVFNEWMKRSLSFEYDYLWLVSSDVMPGPNTLSLLLENADEKTLVGAVCLNSVGGSQNWMYHDACSDCYYRPDVTPPDWCYILEYSPFEVGMIGSPVLIPRAAVESGAQHTDHPQSHICGWYDGLRERGFKVLADPRPRVEHWLDMDTKLIWEGNGAN